MKNPNKSKGFLVFIILLGAIFGSLLGEFLSSNIKYLSVLKKYYTIGTSRPLTLDMKVLSITFGINFNLSLMSIIGIILAIILYRKFQ